MIASERLTHEDDLVEQARAFAQAHVAPYAETWERERDMPVDTLRLAAGRFGGLLVPEEHGGLAASVPIAARVMEELAKADMAFAFSLVVQINMTASIANAGTADHRARFLPDLLNGRRICAFCLTEPEVGTDAAAITTRGRPAAGGWHLDGEKAWVTNGIAADLLCVFAQAHDEPGAGSVAAFLVDGTNEGLTRLPAYELMGGHAMGTTGLKLADCWVDQEDVFLDPGEGFKAAMRGIDLARILLSAMCCGMLATGLDTALAHAGSRQAFGRSVIDFQGVQFEAAEIATKLEAAQQLTAHAASLLHQGADATLAAAHAKKFATRAAFDGLNDAMQIMGAAGYRRNHPLARQLGNAKMAHYLDGTTEVQNVVIGRALAKRAKAS